MAVLDRSWYGRVLVERVEGFADRAAWQRAYEEIRDFERMLTDEGTVLVKFWLHVSSREQLKRFEARAEDPLKSWKLTDEDWRNRKKRRAYTRAIEQMLDETDRENAPWTLVEADSKRYARVKVIETVIAAAEDGMRRHGIKPPQAALAVPAAGVLLRLAARAGAWPWPAACACAGPRSRRRRPSGRWSLGQRAAGVARDEHPDRDERDEQGHADDDQSVARPPRSLVMLSLDGVGVGAARSAPPAAAARSGAERCCWSWASAAAGTASRARSRAMTSVRRSMRARKVLRGRAGENPPTAQEAQPAGQRAHDDQAREAAPDADDPPALVEREQRDRDVDGGRRRASPTSGSACRRRR